MGDDFTLTGFLELQGIHNLDKHINDARVKLASLSPEIKVVGLDKTAAGAQKASKEVRGLSRDIALSASNLQDFGDKAGIALRRFSAFTIAAGTVFGGGRLLLGGLKNAAL